MEMRNEIIINIFLLSKCWTKSSLFVDCHNQTEQTSPGQITTKFRVTMAEIQMERNELEKLTSRLIKFRDERCWQQFHSLKELILSLNLEAGELLELTQWQNADAFRDAIKDDLIKTRLREECADVLAYLLLIAEHANFDLVQATHDKIDQNKIKYPVEKSKGSSKKYTRL